MPFFDDDGNEINPDFILKPALCTTCKHENDESQFIPCTLNRFDQQESGEFICFAYKEIE
jgi:hypothetical protein